MTQDINAPVTNPAGMGVLQSLSAELAQLTAQAAPSVVRVEDGSRLTATGLIWSQDGLIVTTSHGVERDNDLTIELEDGSVHAVALVGRDNDSDIALLRVNATGLPAIRQADGSAAQVGSLTLALARPGRGGLQATLGILSARVESQNNGRAEYILHTDALLYPGFSGGALVGMDGGVVGMTNLMFGRGKGVALGLPIVANVVQSLLAHGNAPRGYLGVSTQQVTIPTMLQTVLNLAQQQALLIVQVEPDSGAERGGLFLGDTLLKLDGQPVADVDALRQHLRAARAGQTLDLQILRGGQLRDMQVTLGSQK